MLKTVETSQNQWKYAQHYGRCHHVESRGSHLNSVRNNSSIKASAASMCVLNSTLKGMLSHEEHFAHDSVQFNSVQDGFCVLGKAHMLSLIHISEPTRPP